MYFASGFTGLFPSLGWDDKKLSHWCCLFRFRDTSTSLNASSKRYVITNPPGTFKLLPTDQVGLTLDLCPDCRAQHSTLPLCFRSLFSCSLAARKIGRTARRSQTTKMNPSSLANWTFRSISCFLWTFLQLWTIFISGVSSKYSMKNKIFYVLPGVQIFFQPQNLTVHKQASNHVGSWCI